MANDAEERLAAQIANPKALGFGVLAIAGWMYSMAWAGWFSREVLGSVTAYDAIILATAGLLVAALASFLRGETWHAVLFMFWAGYSWAIQTQVGESTPEGYFGWFLLTISVFHLFLGAGALRRENGSDRAMVAFGLSLAFLSFALAQFGLPGFFAIVGGYVSLATALLAFWIAAKEIGALS